MPPIFGRTIPRPNSRKDPAPASAALAAPPAALTPPALASAAAPSSGSSPESMISTSAVGSPESVPTASIFFTMSMPDFTLPGVETGGL